MIDLDKLLADTPRIELTDVTENHLPTTFEEWCAIHGEPEYLYETAGEPRELCIDVIECEEEPLNVDTSDVIYEDNKGKLHINYASFSEVFAAVNNLLYSNGVFYTPMGAVSDQYLRGEITRSLEDFGWRDKLDVPTTSLINTVRDKFNCEELPVARDVIPLSNGDLYLKGDKWEFHHNEFKHTPYRLSINYTPQDKPKPLFDKWLSDVFAEEDIPVVQEIMGYLLVPVTAAQEAFFIVGDAETGKSGFGTIMMGLLGGACVSMQTQELVTARFQVASVENKLLAYDDDLGSAALTETGLLKKLITADVPIRGEKKYSNAHEFMSYCRILASTNFMLSSLYDDSDGFFRRLHPIWVKPKDPNRKVIHRFYEMILEQEKEQILRWALIGLKRVIANGWQISWSERSRNYLAGAKAKTVHYQTFVEETCEIGTGDVSSAELKTLYHRWCRENGIGENSDRRFERWLSDNVERLGIVPNKNVNRNGKRVRGYSHMHIRDEWKMGVIKL